MRRDEACWQLTKIAENEIVSGTVSQRLFIIRDGLVCGRAREDALDKEIACQFLTLLADNSLVSDTVNCEVTEIVRRIKGDNFEECEEVVYGDRCRRCPHYKGGN